ncbi:MAG: helicase-exonuclease AddAB subunit AddA [Lachnospiraceae bacterium]|nr:helicase-exonuclease AddAB subunit AddA [Lachnospiraceae bacterium]
MAVEFTPEQKQAIELHNCNILVSAAAGSGKTAVLSKRIVEMVCRRENPVDIDRLLVVTFTNAAAAEMRERISQAILMRLDEDGANEHLQRQAALLHNAQITTIDSFCLFVLRNHFQDIGLDPAFRVADEGEMELLRQEVLGNLLEECFAAKDEDFYRLVEYYCPGGRDSALEKHVLDLYRYALSYPFPEEWLNKRKEDYRVTSLEELEKSDWGEYLFNHLKRTVSSLYQDMEEVKRLCEEPDGPYMYAETVESEAEALVKLCHLTDLSGFETALPAIAFGRLSSKKDASVNEEKRELAKRKREEVKEAVKKLNTDFFSMPLATALRQSETCSQVIGTLVELCLKFKAGLDEKKREKKLLDFSDIEHLALEILVEKDAEGNIIPSKTAEEYRDYFAEVLIDEYQDSNLVQEYLLRAVSGEEIGSYNRFMVGDVKQSIYKFRLARPELFLEKYKTYSTADSGVDSGPGSELKGNGRRIDLHKNFRSRREVIDTVNQVFKQVMTEELGGIVYDDAAALYPGAVYPENAGCESELLLFEKPDREAEENAKEVEALGIADRIRRLMREFYVTDKDSGKLRPVRYGDIVVLLRTGSGWDEEFKAVFAKQGIPAHVNGRTGYFAAQEVRDVLQFLQVLDNPRQDIPLFGVMRSVFGGFSDAEAALIRSLEREEDGTLYAALQAYADADHKMMADEKQDHNAAAVDMAENAAGGTGKQDVALQEKCGQFLEQLAKYRSYTAYMPIRELLQTLVEEYEYLPYVAALPAGEKRLANVEMLFTKAADFEKNSYHGLFHFVRYIEQLEKYNVDFGEANTLDENADVVRIMSIHKSKGLEFPVAIVAGLSKRFNMRDAAEALLVDMDLGLGTDYVNPTLRVKNKTLRKNVLAAKMKLDNLAEELRVLYVAMTRAKEKLILTAAVEEPHMLLEKLGILAAGAENMSTEGAGAYPGSGKLSYTRLTGASCFLDYLLPVFPKIMVKTREESEASRWKESLAQSGRREVLKQPGPFINKQELEGLLDRFAYRYPHEGLKQLYTKTTVSELKKAAMEGGEEEPAKELFPTEEIKPYIPTFMREEESISGTTRGSAMHRVMELLDFTKEYGDEPVLQQAMQDFLKDGRLTQEYAQAVRTGKILHFLHSPLAGRMQQAAKKGKLFKEQPFVYGIEASRLTAKEQAVPFPAEETVLIQGIVDAYFEEEDGLVLLDYKTDVIEQPQELIRRYKAQLDYYQEALESLTGKKVKERILYSFYLGCEVAV